MMARQKVRQHHEVIPATASTPEILVVRSSRRRRTVSAQPQEDGSIRLLVPGASTDAQIREYLESLIPRVQRKQRETSRRRRIFASDDYLTERAVFWLQGICPSSCPRNFPILSVGSRISVNGGDPPHRLRAPSVFPMIFREPPNTWLTPWSTTNFVTSWNFTITPVFAL